MMNLIFNSNSEMKLISQLRNVSESTIHWKRAFRFSEEEVFAASHRHLFCDLIT